MASLAPFWEGPRTLVTARFQNTLAAATAVRILNYLMKRVLPALPGLDIPQKAPFTLAALL